MNKFNYKNLTPFKWFVLENFPFIEADFDALTEWQLFCKIGKEMNKIINSENTLGSQMENVTNAFIELQDYVNNYFSELNVQTEINNKLNEMAEDGTLATIINENIFNELNDNINNTMDKVDILENVKSYDYLHLDRISRDLIRVDSDYYSMQGNCLTEDNIVVRGLLGDTPNYVKLQKINIATMTVLNETIIETGMHCNWISYNSNTRELFITPLYQIIDGNNVNINNILVIDYDTFVLKEYIALPTTEEVHAFSYDSVNDKYYIIGDTKNIYNFDRENNTLNLQCTLDYNYTALLNRLSSYKSYTCQGATVYNNLIYLSSMNPYGLAIFDLDGKLINFYNYTKIAGQGYLLREVQQITPVGNDIYVGTIGYETFEGEYNMTQFFKGNIEHNIGTQYPGFNPISTFDIYVDESNANVNPVGSEENPFKTIGEALDFTYTEAFKGANIHVASGNYPYVYINQPNKILYITGTSNSNTIINGIRIVKSNYIFLRNFTITKDFTDTKNLSMISSYSSDFNLWNINCVDDTNDTFITVNNSKITFIGLTVNNSVCDMLTNKHIIDCLFSSVIICNDDICPLIVFDDNGNTLQNPVRFCSNFQYYYGDISLPDEFFNMLTNKSIKEIIFEYSTAETANENILKSFKMIGNNSDSFRLETTRISGANDTHVMQVNINYNVSDKTMTLSSNKDSNNNTVTEKTDNETQAYFISLFNIYLR